MRHARHMRRTLLPFVAVLALVAAGCGGDDDDSGSATTAAPAATAPAPAAEGTDTAAAGEVVTVDMKNIQFSPKDITVKVGQTVKWVNQDSVDHDAVAEKGADFKSDQFGQGGTFEWTADKAGKVDYVCTLHPGMVGTITVR